MKSETRNALKEEATDYRARGNAMLAHADRIDDLLRNDPLLSMPMAAQESAPLSPPPAPTIPRFKRQGAVSQTEGAKVALQILGRPATLKEIADTITGRGIPAVVGSLESFRTVLSRSGAFESNGSGQWRLMPGVSVVDAQLDNPLLRGPNGHTHTDLSVNRDGQRAEEGQES